MLDGLNRPCQLPAILATFINSIFEKVFQGFGHRAGPWSAAFLVTKELSLRDL